MRAVSFVPRYEALCNKHPDTVGPNIKANVEEGLRYRRSYHGRSP
jgi:hypothetical protein